ncbi:MAG TPA: peptidase, partial [Phenylobacterium sp.]|nr:peptidase [Phenylobacterium sp.]
NGAPDRQSDIEVMDTASAAAFDPLVAADVGAEVTLNTLLAPARLTRVYEQHRRDPANLGLDELVDQLLTKTVSRRNSDLERRIAYRTVLALAKAAHDPDTSPDVALVLTARLDALAAQLAKGGDAWSRGLSRTLSDPDLLEKELAKAPRAPSVPPGMPIGAETGWMDDIM